MVKKFFALHGTEKFLAEFVEAWKWALFREMNQVQTFTLHIKSALILSCIILIDTHVGFTLEVSE
jgi:hypothetical protein